MATIWPRLLIFGRSVRRAQLDGMHAPLARPDPDPISQAGRPAQAMPRVANPHANCHFGKGKNSVNTGTVRNLGRPPLLLGRSRRLVGPGAEPGHLWRVEVELELGLLQGGALNAHLDCNAVKHAEPHSLHHQQRL